MHLHWFQIINPASSGGKGLIYNDDAEHEVTDRENNVEEELVSDINIEAVEFIEQRSQKSPQSNAWISDAFLPPS